MIRESRQISIIIVLFISELALFGCSKNSSAQGGITDDQSLFQVQEMKGGTSYLNWNIPFGGGTLVAGRNYIYSTSSGGLSRSPLTSGPQIQTPQVASLDSALSIPRLGPSSRILIVGQVWLEEPLAPRKVSYVSEGVQYDFLDASGTTVLSSLLYSNFSSVSLNGYMENSPEEFVAAIPIKRWMSFNNFSSNAKWLPGSGYQKRQVRRINDTVFTMDCGNSTATSDYDVAIPNPCQYGTTLDQFFPISMFENGNGHPDETDFSTDGTITMIQGVRMWVANNPLPIVMQNGRGYRAFYELNGNVYMGLLEKGGTPILYTQNDGSTVNYDIGMNEAALSSIQKGLITGAVAPGTLGGSASEVQGTADLFGIGGHGVNGSLAPADLKLHYDTPPDLTGVGQTIAIVDAPGSGNPSADLDVFSQYYGLPLCDEANRCFQHVDLSNGAQVPSSGDWGTEVALDTQTVHGMAPAAQLILVTAASNVDTDVINAINTAAQLPGVTAISMSFDYSNPDLTAEDTQLAGFQSQRGLIFFSSSGDDGHLSELAYPAASPYVTGVGGTRIQSVAWHPQAVGETAWEFSGGGNSTYAQMPAWQSTFLGAALAAPEGGLRAIPDVSAVADFQHSAIGIYYKDSWRMEGGTSASAPIWAGISALFGEYLAKKGQSLPSLVKATPGGFNGLLYQMKLMQAANQAFYDITSGSNNLSSGECPLCQAGQGYDNITGLGSPDVTALFSYF